LPSDIEPPRNRDGTALPRAVLIGSLLPLCWLAMQAVHEAGHVLTACATGGTVKAVVLHPLTISRTDVSPNPRPLAVVWGGPVFGSVAPVAAWLLAGLTRRRSAYLWRFFAGFCLIANGAYLGYGIIEPIGDAADLVRLGTPPWPLAAFGVIAVPAGLALWHGQGPAFGLGPRGVPVPASHAWGTLASLLVVVVTECVWSVTTGFM
jgi:hypothetical protein